MRNNETGEFELVVGNRQLLSGFAIVVLLFGVGVAMGYILGQNAPRSAKLQPDAASVSPLAESRPQPASPTPAPQQATPAASTDNSAAAPAEGTPATTPAEVPPPTATQPAREPAAPVTTAQAPVVAAPSPIPEAPPGSYWQVMAVPQADAEAVVRVLKEQGFPALLGPGTKNLTRVLVGPYRDTQAMGKAKTLLEGAGFHPVRKPID